MYMLLTYGMTEASMLNLIQYAHLPIKKYMKEPKTFCCAIVCPTTECTLSGNAHPSSLPVNQPTIFTDPQLHQYESY
jgi:hypothetical protein